MKKRNILITGTLFFTLIAVLAFFKIDNSKINIAISKPQTIKVSPNTIEPKTITILPIGNNLTSKFIWDAFNQIKKYLPSVGLDALTSFPSSAYNKKRGRYRADSLINWMSRLAKPNQVFIGITNVDISTTAHGYEDWGVMGLGKCPGNAAIASSFRLKNKTSFWKIAIHELGHTTGLPHCPVKTCFMRDAEGGDPTGEEKEFCSKCKDVLLKNGWKL